MNTFDYVESPLDKHVDDLFDHLNASLVSYPTHKLKVTKPLCEEIVAHYFGFRSHKSLLVFLNEILRRTRAIGRRKFIEINFPIHRALLRVYNCLREKGVSSVLAYDIRTILFDFYLNTSFDIKDQLQLNIVKRHKVIRLMDELIGVREMVIKQDMELFFREKGLVFNDSVFHAFINNISMFLGFINSSAMHDFCNNLYPMHISQRMEEMRAINKDYFNSYINIKKPSLKNRVMDKQFEQWAKDTKISACYLLRSVDRYNRINQLSITLNN